MCKTDELLIGGPRPDFQLSQRSTSTLEVIDWVELEAISMAQNVIMDDASSSGINLDFILDEIFEDSESSSSDSASGSAVASEEAMLAKSSSSEEDEAKESFQDIFGLPSNGGKNMAENESNEDFGELKTEILQDMDVMVRVKWNLKG